MASSCIIDVRTGSVESGIAQVMRKAVDNIAAVAERTVLSFDTIRHCLCKIDNDLAEIEVLMAFFEAVISPALGQRLSSGARESGGGNGVWSLSSGLPSGSDESWQDCAGLTGIMLGQNGLVYQTVNSDETAGDGSSSNAYNAFADTPTCCWHRPAISPSRSRYSASQRRSQRPGHVSWTRRH